MSITFFVGVAFAFYPFISYFGPAWNSGETLPHIKVSEMQAGTYRMHDDEHTGWYGTRYLIIKNFDNSFLVYWLPTYQNSIVMPDLRWYRWGGLCENFGPELVNGKIKKNGLIKCHDKEIEEYHINEWQWTLTGKKLGQWTDDMESMKSTVSGYYLILGKG